jgi:YVTN family beta-propeller protein
MTPAGRLLISCGLALGLLAPCRAAEPAPGAWTPPVPEPADARYKSPIQLLLSPDGRRLFVACEQSGEVLVVDTRSRQVLATVAVGGEPFGLALAPGGKTLYAGCRRDNEVAVVDLAALQVQSRLRVGDDPHGLVLSPDGRLLMVANLGTGDLSVVDLAQGRETRRLPLGKAPFGLALSPDGKTLYASSQYSNPVPFRAPPVIELSAVDVEAQRVRERRPLAGAVIGQGIAVSPDGQWVVAAVELPKNLIPETQVYQGWMVTFGFALGETRPGGRNAYLLIDEPNLYYADPYGVAFSPDGRWLYLSSSGADALTVVDFQAACRLLGAEAGRIGAPEDTLRRFARHLGLSSEYAAARIPTGANPKGLALSPDGRWLYAALRLADQVAVIDTRRRAVVYNIDLGGPREVTALRRGAQLFNYASISFQKQLSCATCHPENSVDGLSYDIAADGGMGHNIVDNMTMRQVGPTHPFKWRGKNPTIERQDGPRAAQLFFRTHGFEPEDRRIIARFIESIPKRPNRYLAADGRLDKTQQLGKKLFERAYDNQGRYIPVGNRCVSCHPLPYGTDHFIHDVGSKNYHDLDGNFDTPHLANTYERAPYLHDGRCYSLEEIWTVHNPGDTHGVTNDMSKDQLNALIEYIKTF